MVAVRPKDIQISNIYNLRYLYTIHYLIYDAMMMKKHGKMK